MKESLTRRVGRLISGSFHALVEAVEQTAPETVMEQAIREIDGVMEEVRAELGKVLANKHLAKTRLEEENRKHRDLAEKIEIAVSEGRDDLAGTAISRQLDIEAQMPVLEATVAECTSKEKELEGFIEAMHARKREMNEELRLYRESRRQAPGAVGSASSGTSASGGNVEKRLSDAESAFDRVLEKAAGVPGGQGLGGAKAAAQMAELEDMARKNRIQERLATIKGKIERK
jgi:phage shock protein A